jgi:hypothetical protein
VFNTHPLGHTAAVVVVVVVVVVVEPQRSPGHALRFGPCLRISCPGLGLGLALVQLYDVIQAQLLRAWDRRHVCSMDRGLPGTSKSKSSHRWPKRVLALTIFLFRSILYCIILLCLLVYLRKCLSIPGMRPILLYIITSYPD